MRCGCFGSASEGTDRSRNASWNGRHERFFRTSTESKITRRFASRSQGGSAARRTDLPGRCGGPLPKRTQMNEAMQNIYTVRDESGSRAHIEASSPRAAAEQYVASGDYSGSSTGYVEVAVFWIADDMADESDFRITVPGWTGCAYD